MKTFFFACLLALNFIFACPEAKTASAQVSEIQNISEEDYVYVRVDVDGVPWIYVYDSKGNLVYAYPEQ